MKPRLRAMVTAWARLLVPSFEKMLYKSHLTVAYEAAECSLSQTSLDRSLAVVLLYKAPGGGWSVDKAQFANGR
jgi:hypothetical protein